MNQPHELTPTSLPQPGDILLGRYVIENVITRGGFATIYRGRQLGVDRTVAVKCLDPDSIKLDPAAPQRFAREARLASGLVHPNTITIFDYGRTERGVLFLVMEHVEGVSLNRILRYGKLDAERAVHLVKQMCHSLREAHSRDIIHRDLKPANIMICDRAGEQDVVKVLDFGIAKALSEKPGGLTPANLTQELTGSDRVIGTPRYMSPEQLRGEPVSPASDLYSVGLILFEMLLGRPAIDKPTSLENMTAQMSDDPIRIPTDSGIPPWLLPTLAKAIDKNPKRRFQRSEDFIEALDCRGVKVGAGADPDLKTRPISAEEIEHADPRRRPRSDSGTLIAVERSGPYPPALVEGGVWSQRPRLLLMFNVLLAVLLVAVGATLGVLLVSVLTGQRQQAPAVIMAPAVPEPQMAQGPRVVESQGAPALPNGVSTRPPNEKPPADSTAVAMYGSMAAQAPGVPSVGAPGAEAFQVGDATGGVPNVDGMGPAPLDTAALGTAAAVTSPVVEAPMLAPPALPRLDLEMAQSQVHRASLVAANTAEPLAFVFTGIPADAQVFLGPDRLGAAGDVITIARQRLPAEVEIRRLEYASEYTTVGADNAGQIVYALQREATAEATSGRVRADAESRRADESGRERTRERSGNGRRSRARAEAPPAEPAGPIVPLVDAMPAATDGAADGTREEAAEADEGGRSSRRDRGREDATPRQAQERIDVLDELLDADLGASPTTPALAPID